MRLRCQIELTSSVAFDRTTNGCDREREKNHGQHKHNLYLRENFASKNQQTINYRVLRFSTVCLKCKEFQTPSTLL